MAGLVSERRPLGNRPPGRAPAGRHGKRIGSWPSYLGFYSGRREQAARAECDELKPVAHAHARGTRRPPQPRLPAVAKEHPPRLRRHRDDLVGVDHQPTSTRPELRPVDRLRERACARDDPRGQVGLRWDRARRSHEKHSPLPTRDRPAKIRNGERVHAAMPPARGATVEQDCARQCRRHVVGDRRAQDAEHGRRERDLHGGRRDVRDRGSRRCRARCEEDQRREPNRCGVVDVDCDIHGFTGFSASATATTSRATARRRGGR